MARVNNQVKLGCIILGLSVILTGFQNCSEAVFGTRGKASDGIEVTTGDPDDDKDDDDDDDCRECPEYPKEYSKSATVAFEDLFPNPWHRKYDDEVGARPAVAYYNDYDYNDFVVNYKVKELYSEEGLKRIDIEFKPKAKLAGYDHELLINLVGRRSTRAEREDNIRTLPAIESDGATAVLQTYSSDGSLLSVKDVDPLEDISIFPRTSELFNPVTQAPLVRSVLTVFLASEENTPIRSSVELDRYRLMLKINHSSEVLEIVDINKYHMDPNGYPYGIRIPGDAFDYPEERQDIKVKYPKFASYREYLLEKFDDPTYVGSDDEINWYINALMALSQNI